MLSYPAIAASPTSNVSGPRVSKGKFDTEARFGHSTKRETTPHARDYKFRQHIDYGFTDFYAFRLVVAQQNPDNDNFEHSKLGFENRFHIVKKEDAGWDFGARLFYDQKDGDKSPHEIGVNLISEIPFADDWRLRTNVILSNQIGENAQGGSLAVIRNKIVRKISANSQSIKNIELGLAMFNDFGKFNNLDGYETQKHELRPVIKFSFRNGFYTRMGYGFGISDGNPDRNIQFNVGRKF